MAGGGLRPATGLLTVSDRNESASRPLNPFAAAQGGHHSLALHPFSILPFTFGPWPLLSFAPQIAREKQESSKGNDYGHH